MKTHECPSVIVQARSGSTRLPGKVSMMLEGRPVLLHFLDRVKRMEYVDRIIIATTDTARDDVIVEMLREYDPQLGIFRGSENDVLDRFYQAAKKYDLSHIVRITPDCPLIDPNVTDGVIQAYMGNDCDYCSNTMPRSFPHGLDTEVFSFGAMELAWNEAFEPREREHVTPYIREHPETFKHLNVANAADLSGLRWTLDYPEDLEFMKEVYKRLYHLDNAFSMEETLDLLKNEPWIGEINRSRRV